MEASLKLAVLMDVCDDLFMDVDSGCDIVKNLVCGHIVKL